MCPSFSRIKRLFIQQLASKSSLMFAKRYGSGLQQLAKPNVQTAKTVFEESTAIARPARRQNRPISSAGNRPCWLRRPKRRLPTRGISGRSFVRRRRTSWTRRVALSSNSALD
jgi:hypothetical protein